MNEAWPPERFYWAILDSPGPVRAGIVPPGLAVALEDELPEPLDLLHAVCAPAADGRVLVCAARRADLATLTPEVERLTPESLPSWADGQPGDLNLLVGPFEPREVRRRRSRGQFTAMATVTLCTVLLVLGLIRRAQHWQHRTADSRSNQAALVHLAGVDSDESLALELNKTRRENAGRIQRPPDASLSLDALLALWPTVPSKALSLSISERTAAIAVSVEGDASPFLKAFNSPDGWTLEEPRVNSMGSLTRLTLLLNRKEQP